MIPLSEYESILHTLMIHFEGSDQQKPLDGSDPETEESRQYTEGVQFSIRAVVSLFGQEGYNEIVHHQGVQETLRATPLNEFAEGGVFPNILLLP